MIPMLWQSTPSMSMILCASVSIMDTNAHPLEGSMNFTCLLR